MIHSEVSERFVEDSPVCVMVQTLLEDTLPPTTVDTLFERHAELQYTRNLLFSDVVHLMSLVVCGIRPCPFLKRLAGAVRLSEFGKQPRGPKKPRPQRQSGAEIKHVATAKLIEEQQTKPPKSQK